METMKELKFDWEITGVISNKFSLDEVHVQNVVSLLENDCTVPFIARYRKDLTNDMAPDNIRKIKDAAESLKNVREKAKSVLNVIKGQGKVTPVVIKDLQSCKSLGDVEDVYAPFKKSSSASRATKARALGLEDIAMKLLNNDVSVNINTYRGFVRAGEKGVSTVDEVVKGVSDILADVFSKEKDVMDAIKRQLSQANTVISSSIIPSAAQSDKKSGTSTKQSQVEKFENYANFSIPTRFVKPFQVLALNRGENQKILRITVTFPDHLKTSFTHICARKWRFQGSDWRCGILQAASQDSWDRLILPKFTRDIRRTLSENAESASLEVFAQNLRRLLLQPPVRSHVILGLDPGFTNGCKAAVISPSGKILHTIVFYLMSRSAVQKQREIQKLVDTVNKYRCDIVAIGNGVGCRESEEILHECIANHRFTNVDVKYCIVSEDGASVYSVSPEAERELPELDHSLRGAVSIGRRLQDPLAELVKIEAKHLGVGMYQHDMKDTRLRDSLEDVVQECVSFVGVDVNTCSEYLLRKVSGLNKTRAKNIIDWREKNGSYVNRQQLLDVKGIALMMSMCYQAKKGS